MLSQMVISKNGNCIYNSRGELPSFLNFLMVNKKALKAPLQILPNNKINFSARDFAEKRPTEVSL